MVAMLSAEAMRQPPSCQCCSSSTAPTGRVIGRSGQHRFNNHNQLLITGVLAAENLCEATHDIW